MNFLFSSDPNAFSNARTISGMSDHLAILFQVNVKASRSFKPPHKFFDHKRADIDGLRKSISDSAENFLASAVQGNWSLFN